MRDGLSEKNKMEREGESVLLLSFLRLQCGVVECRVAGRFVEGAQVYLLALLALLTRIAPVPLHCRAPLFLFLFRLRHLLRSGFCDIHLGRNSNGSPL